MYRGLQAAQLYNEVALYAQHTLMWQLWAIITWSYDVSSCLLGASSTDMHGLLFCTLLCPHDGCFHDVAVDLIRKVKV